MQLAKGDFHAGTIDSLVTLVSNIPEVSTLALRMSCSEGEKFSCRTVATFSKKYLAQSISCKEIDVCIYHGDKSAKHV